MAGRDNGMVGRRSSRAVRARRAAIAIGLAIAAVAAVIAWRAGSGSAAPAPLSAASLTEIEQGWALYEQHCASCHGANLEGEPDWRERKPSGRLPAPPHDDSGHTWHHPDEVLLAITRNGMRPPIAPAGYQSDMPGFEGVLDEAQIRAVLGFIASRWSEQSRAHQARIDRAHRDAR